MKARARILPLAIALSVLSAYALSANDDERKKHNPPPSSAQPQHSNAPQVRSQAPNSPPREAGNRPTTPSGVTHAQPGRGPEPSRHREVEHEQLHQRMSVHPSERDRMHAHEAYKLERGRFTRHMEPMRFAPGHRLILNRMHVVPGTYYYRRNAFYGTYGWVTPPYVYTMYPRYGLWDAGFLAFALHHVAEEQYAMMLYNHWADPEIQQWARDTNRAAAHNARLRAQVAEMNDRVLQLEQSGMARDAMYVPPDAQDVALSPDAVDQWTSR